MRGTKNERPLYHPTSFRSFRTDSGSRNREMLRAWRAWV